MPYRYIENEGGFKPIAEKAFAERFPDTADFEEFYAALATPERKNKFLRTAAFYRYLVKQGRWVHTVDDPDQEHETEYITNSYKVVGLFALIESLSNEKFMDFYQWLVAQGESVRFPIADKADLDKLHVQYKKTYGAIRRCLAFFARLSELQQRKLRETVKLKRVPMKDIRRLAEFLYNVRSKFVHEADLALVIGNPIFLSLGGKGLMRTELPAEVLQEAFEEGVIAYFRADLADAS